MLEAEALSIYTEMANSGASLQQTLAVIYQSGMNVAYESLKADASEGEEHPLHTDDLEEVTPGTSPSN
jgi:hypothetical protein